MGYIPLTVLQSLEKDKVGYRKVFLTPPHQIGLMDLGQDVAGYVID